jgi:hypothetical protein
MLQTCEHQLPIIAVHAQQRLERVRGAIAARCQDRVESRAVPHVRAVAARLILVAVRVLHDRVSAAPECSHGGKTSRRQRSEPEQAKCPTPGAARRRVRQRQCSGHRCERRQEHESDRRRRRARLQ